MYIPQIILIWYKLYGKAEINSCQLWLKKLQEINTNTIRGINF